MPEQSLLGLLAPHHPGGDDPHQAGQVPSIRIGLQRGQDRLGEGVAHDDQAVHLLPLHGVEQLDRVELARRQQHHPAALAQALEGGEPAGPVHQRTGRQQGHPRSLLRQGLADSLHAGLLAVLPETGTVQQGEEIILAPHDPLGHAGGPTGVEQVEIVRAPSPWGPGPLAGVAGAIAGGVVGGDALVGHRPRGAGRGPVVHPQPAPDARDPVTDALDAFGEHPVEDHRHRVGVLPQVGELVVGVPVVGVDGDQADLEDGEGRLQVLGAVVEIEGDLVLLGHAGPQEPPRHVVRPAVGVLP